LTSTRWKRFAATAVVGVVLGTVLVLVFHAFTLRTQEHISTTALQKTNHSAEQVSGDSAVPTNLDLSLPVPVASPVGALPVPAPIASPQSPPSQSTHLPSLKATTNVLPRPSAQAGNVSSFAKPSPALSRPRVARIAASTRRPQRVNAKPMEANHKDSRIGSFLKKTGHILKKPFGF